MGNVQIIELVNKINSVWSKTWAINCSSFQQPALFFDENSIVTTKFLISITVHEKILSFHMIKIPPNVPLGGLNTNLLKHLGVIF